MEASRRGTEKCVAGIATSAVIWQVNSNFPKAAAQVFLCELWFVLGGLCGEIDLRNLG
jgi:hypothetical protein